MSQAGVLDVTASNPIIPTRFDADTDFAIPVLNVLEILGGAGVVTTGSGNTITIALTGAGVGIDTIAPNSGINVIPDGAGLVTVIGTGSITTVGTTETLTVQLTGLTVNNVLIGAGTATVTKVAPSATVGVALVSTGAASDPAFGTVSVGGGGTGNISFTAGSVIFSNGTILTEDNANFFWDDTLNNLGLGTTSPIHTLEVQGHVGIVVTSTENDAHGLEIVANAAGFADFKAIDIDYITGALAAGEEDAVILINIDESLAAGGEIFGLEVLSTTEGTDVVGALKSGIGVAPVHSESGSFGDVFNSLNKAVDVTAALKNGGAGNISGFVADNDTMTFSNAAKWDEFEIILGTGASGGGIAPVYAFSTGGAGFTNFVPVDGTNGFKNTGIVDWNSGDLSGWATNASGRFEIRITRTRNTLSTTPILDEVQSGAATEFVWDASGDVNINSLVLVTDLAVAHGGTGVSTLTDGGVMLGSGTGAVTSLAQATDGQLVIGDTSADPVLATLTAPAAGITIAGGAGTITFALANDLAAAEGLSGTGFITRTGADAWADTAITDNAFVLGDASEVPQMLGPATSGQVPIGVTSGTPLLQDMTWMPVSGGYIFNIGFTLSGGTFTVNGSEGTALATTNPGYALIRDKTNDSQFKLYTITGNQNFIDDAGVSEIVDNLFGMTTGVAYASNRPFFVYFVVNDDEDAVQCMLSDNPCATTSPAAANIGAPDDAVADAQGDFWSFDNIDETLFNGNPCLSIGAIRMVMSSSDDWTVQALSKLDGPGRYQESTDFNMPRSVFGAASNSYILVNAGTEPTSATDDECQYRLDRFGWVDVFYNMTFNNTPSGANVISVILPYVEFQTGQSMTFNFANGYWADANVTKVMRYAITQDSRLVVSFVEDEGTSALTNASFASSDDLRFVLRYRAFDTNEV